MSEKDHSKTALVVTLGYRGRPTGEQYFEAGTYEPGTVPHGIGDYLVQIGRAHWSGEKPKTIGAPPDRDMSGRIITMGLPQPESVVDPVVPIYAQPAMSVSHEDTVYPWQEAAAALIAGAPSGEALDNLAALIGKVRAGETAPPDEDESDGESDEDDSLEDSYTQPELFKMARDMGLDVKSNWSKTKLAEAIEEKQGAGV